MKRNLLVSLITLFLVGFIIACTERYEEESILPTEQMEQEEQTEQPPNTVVTRPSPDKYGINDFKLSDLDLPEDKIDRTNAVGMILGDVFFDDIPISQLFLEPFAEVLGPSTSDHLPFFPYDGISIAAASCLEMTSQISVDRNRLRINEIALDNITTQEDLIVALGESLAYYEYSDGSVFRHNEENRSMRYHVLSPAIEYILTFRFEDPYDRTIITSVSINRMPGCVTRKMGQ